MIVLPTLLWYKGYPGLSLSVYPETNLELKSHYWGELLLKTSYPLKMFFKMQKNHDSSSAGAPYCFILSRFWLFNVFFDKKSQNIDIYIHFCQEGIIMMPSTQNNPILPCTQNTNFPTFHLIMYNGLQLPFKWVSTEHKWVVSMSNFPPSLLFEFWQE